VFLPLKDINPTRRRAWITMALIGVNAAVFAVEIVGLAPADEWVHVYGLVPARFEDGFFSRSASGVSPTVSLFTSLFLHGDLLHLLGNLLYLWIFGNNMEDALGSLRFLLFYLLAGLGGHAAHLGASWGSTVPTIGASGAIAGVLAAYLIRYPRARIVSLLFLGFFVRLVRVPASIVIGFWFFLQLLSGVSTLGATADGGIAWFEHIGGFVTGLALFPLLAAGRRGGHA
jgi:membrane associated rhomboid family serine protease